MSAYDNASLEMGATGLYPWFWGSYWLGRTIIPPVPVFFGMTDRVTGTVWYPVFSSDQTHIIFQLTKPGPNAPIRIFAPWDGPFIGQSGLRIGISNGHIVVDTLDGTEGAGPFIRDPSNFNHIAGIFATFNQTNGPIYDHLMFQVGSANLSVFAAPKSIAFDQFLPGGPDVLAP